MSSLQECLIEAMNTVSTSNIANQATTITIECEILDVIDLGVGLYSVKYLGNIFKVYSNNINYIYNKGDKVYVLVPNGNFGKEKFIIGSVYPSIINYVDPITNEKQYRIIEDNLFERVSDGASEIINLCTYHSEEKNLYIEAQSDINIDKVGNKLANYLQEYDTIALNCSIKTDIFKDQQINGDYGIILYLPIKKILKDGTIDNNAWKEISVNTDTLIGNPYNLQVWTQESVYAIFDPTTETYDLERRPRLKAYIKNFMQSEEEKPYDIWIKNISLSVVEILGDKALTGYYLALNSDSGNFFINNGTENKKITPILYINGKETDYSSYQCYWFIENAAVVRNHQDYSNIGGIGWQCLNEKDKIIQNDDGSISFEYVTNKYEIEIKKEMFSSIRIKCCLLIDKIVVNGYLTIGNLTSDINIKFYPANNSNEVIKGIGYTTLYCDVKMGDIASQQIDKDTLFYTFSRYDEEGNFLDNDFYTLIKINELLSDGTIRTEITVDSSLIYNINSIYCTVHRSAVEQFKNTSKILVDSEGQPILDEHGLVQYYTYEGVNTYVLGTKKIVLVSRDTIKFSLNISNGNKLYKYDADGNSPLVADYNGPISSRINSITPLNFNLYREDGTELTETEYKYCKITWKVPNEKNSMLIFEGIEDSDKDYIEIKYDGRHDLSYTISNQYSAIKTNNTVLLEVEFDRKIYSTSVGILFSKDGESGTNGTAYSAILNYVGQDGRSYALNERNSEGIVQKPRLVYIGVTTNDEEEHSILPGREKWYTYVSFDENIETNSEIHLRELNAVGETYKPKFNIELFKDGEKINDLSSYKIEYSWYDKKITGALFNLRTDGTMAIVNGYNENGGKWLNSADSPCNILQAKIKVSDGDSVGADQYIFAYYPIEITRIANIPNIMIDPEDNNNITFYGTLPTIEGGFYNVLYSSDGKNPKFDSSNDFICIDGVQEEEFACYNYEWTSKINPLDETERTNLILNPKGEHYRRCEIKPAPSWLNGNTKNFVKIKSVFNSDEYDSQHTAELIAEARIENAAAYNWVKFYDNITPNNHREDLLNLANSYNYNSWVNNINSIKNLIVPRGDLINTLSELSSKADLWKNYFVQKEYRGPYEYLTVFDEIVAKLSLAVTAAENICQSSEDHYGLDNLIDLSNLSLLISDRDKEILRPTIGNFGLEYLDNIGYSFNSVINVYEEIRNILIEKDDNNQYVLDNSANILYNIIEDCKVFLNAMYPLTQPKSWTGVKTEDPLIDKKWISIYNKCLKYINYFKDKSYSINIIKSEIFDKINEEIKLYIDKDTKNLTEFKYNYLNLQLENSRYKASTTAAALSKLILIDNIRDNSIVHIRPIVMRMNTYSMSNINAWDGNKIYIDGDGDGSYILAPQMGAGIKNEYNQFTGLVMGIRNLGGVDSQDEVGLYAYSNGENTVTLNAQNGSAIFGKAGQGQIIIDPTEGANIRGGDFNYKPGQEDSQGNPLGSGMEINLSSIDIANPQGPYIRYGSGYFEIDKNGHLKATSANISGTIVANLGKIGGWIIGETKLYTEDNKLTLNAALNYKYTKDSNGNVVLIDDDEAQLDNYYTIEDYFMRTTISDYSAYKTCNWLLIFSDRQGKELYPLVYEIHRKNLVNNEWIEDSINGRWIEIELEGIVYHSLRYRYSASSNSSYIQDDNGNYLYIEDQLLGSNKYYQFELTPSDTVIHYNYSSDRNIYIKFTEVNNSLYCDYYEVYKGFYKQEGSSHKWIDDVVNGDWYKIILPKKTIYTQLIDNQVEIDDIIYYFDNFYQFSKPDDIASNNLYIKFTKNKEDIQLNNNKYNSYYKAQRGRKEDGEWIIDSTGDKIKFSININNEIFNNESYFYKVSEGPGIYSGNHNFLENTTNGFYLGAGGFSLNNNIRFNTIDNTFKISASSGGFAQSNAYYGSNGLSICGSSFKVSAEDGHLYCYQEDVSTLNVNGLINFVDSKGNTMTVSNGFISKKQNDTYDSVVWWNDLNPLLDSLWDAIYASGGIGDYLLDFGHRLDVLEGQGNNINIISTNVVPMNPERNTIYLIQGEVLIVRSTYYPEEQGE